MANKLFFRKGIGPLAAMFIVFFAIWCGVYFGIYYYFLQIYAPATCEVISSRSFKTNPNSPNHFRLLNVNVFIKGKVYGGFGCEADSYEMPEVVNDTPGIYPYQFSTCLSWQESGSDECFDLEMFMPRWLCSKYSSDTAFQPETLYDCSYKLRNGQTDNLDAENIATNYLVDIYTPFIEVIFKDEPYYPRNSYLTLMILCLGICSILPFTIVLFIFIPGSDNFKVYKKLFPCYWKLYVFFRRYVLFCSRFYDPRIAVDDRKSLFRHAFIHMKMRMKPNLRKRVEAYIY